MAEFEQIDVKLSKTDAEKNEKVNLWGGLDTTSILEKHKIPLILALFGLILLLGGIFVLIRTGQPEDKIEIIPAQERGEVGEDNLLIDIEGAVMTPGVYELPFGSRVNDLLVISGGLAADADREWVTKSLNKAQKLKDGDKIYIPKESERVKGQESLSGGVLSQQAQANVTKKVNINTASESELDKLWGVGPATAKKIIENRPYQQVSDLLTKKVLGSNVYQKIAEQLSIW